MTNPEEESELQRRLVRAVLEHESKPTPAALQLIETLRSAIKARREVLERAKRRSR